MTLGISQALAAAAADGSLAEFFSDLTSCGGRVVAEMLEGAVEAAVGGREEQEKEEKKKKKGKRGGDDDDDDEGALASSAAAASAAAAAAAAASYERLHSGPWHAVPAAWRDAYSLACLLQASDAGAGADAGEEGEREGGKDFDGGSSGKRTRMRLLDLALLLGGRRFRALVHSAAAALSADLSTSSPPAPLLLPEAWPLPATPVELPPGSLGSCGPDDETGQRVETLASSSPSSDGGGGGAPPSLEDFVARASSAADPAPLLLPRCVSSWPALSRWASPRYWDRVAGPRTVPVEVGGSYLEEGWSQVLMPLRAFLDDHILQSSSSSSSSASEDPERRRRRDRKTGYLAQHDLLEQVPELARDVLTPDYALALSSSSSSPDDDGGDGGGSGGDDGGGEDGGDNIARNLWLGPARTLSPLHTDPRRNLLCQVFGRKYVRLYRPDEENSRALLLAGREEAEGEGEKKKRGGGVNVGSGPPPASSSSVTDALTAANTSRADLFAPSERVAALRFFDVVLTPGDALYIPKGWWHFVLSLEPSASVSFWF